MRVRLLLLNLVLIVSSVFAHQDPLGDVHPSVVVEGEQFVIYFHRNEGQSQGQLFKTVVSKDGTTLQKRVPAEGSIPVPEWAAKLGSFAPFESKERGGSGLPLKWNEPHPYIDGFTMAGERLFFHISNAGSKKGDPFFIAEYDLQKKELVSTATVGIPGRIYSFTVASPVYVVGQDAYVAWIEERDRKIEKEVLANGGTADVVSSKTQLVLSRWRIGEKEVMHLPIRQTFDYNTDISIDRIGDSMLIAWHEGLGLYGSQIWTQSVDLKSAVFRRDLPYSEVPSSVPFPQGR